MSKLTLNIGLLGGSGAGKTSIIKRFSQGKFDSSILSTISLDKISKEVTIDGEKVKLVLIDTAGQERYADIVANFFRRLNGVIFVYAINSEISFDKVKVWLEKAKELSNQNFSFIIVGNKKDLEINEIVNDENDLDNSEKNYRTVSEEQGKELAEELKCEFFEVSAKENINIEEAFMCLAKNVYNIKKNMKVIDSNTQTLRKKNSKKKCDC